MIKNAQNIFIQRVTADSPHQDYQKVVALRKLYRQLITGEGIEDLLIQFSPRENDLLFSQRKALTQSITPAVAGMLMNPAYKVPRVRPVINKIDFDGGETKDIKTRVAKVEDVIRKYYGDLSLDDFIEARIIDLCFSDPNAFLVNLFGKDDTNKRYVYSKEISSEEAWDFEYINNTLQWLLTKNSIPALITQADNQVTTSATETWSLFQLYTSDTVFRMEQIDGAELKNIISTTGIVVDVVYQGVNISAVKVDDNRFFKYNEYKILAGEVPCVRVGYKRDLTTKGRTYVNPFHMAVPYFMKTIKTVSEMDLTMSLHTFLQKIAYQPKCRGVSKEISCDRGWTPDGKICTKCRGVGYEIHTSAQDSILMGLPNDPDKIVDLSKLVHYVNIPIDILEFQDKYIEKLEQKAIKAMYNSELFVVDRIATTATEKNIDLESVYDTLYSFAKQLGRMRCVVVRTSAHYIGEGDKIIVDWQYPKDFKFKTTSTLLAEINLANTGNTSAYVKEELNNDLSEQLYIDKPDMRSRLRVKKLFDPFDGRTTDEIRFLMSDSDILREDKVLYKNFKRIFIELEEESISGVGPDNKVQDKTWFYDMTYAEQKKLVDAKVKELIIELKSQVQEKTPFSEIDDGGDSGDDPNPDNLSPEEQDALNAGK
jgi:hypothetical protein